TGGFRLGLVIPKLTLVLVESRTGTPTKSFALNGHSDAQAREWLGRELATWGLDPHALDAPAPYEIPWHPIAQSGTYDPDENAEGLIEFRSWFANGARSLALVQRGMNERTLTASPVRCWPHHFDLATLISFSAKASGTTAYVGVGIEPGDNYYD